MDGNLRRPGFILALCLWITAVCQADRLVGDGRDLFEQAHEQLLRISYNEAGKSHPDADGILSALAAKARDAEGPIVLELLMIRMIRHSPRTFPIDSSWRAHYGRPKRLRHMDKLRTPRNAWSSALKLDCGQPPNYPYKRWDREGCFELVDYTRKLLRGKIQSRCRETPTTWGSCVDVDKLPATSSLHEVSCDHIRPWVPGNVVDCKALRADCTLEGRRRLVNTPQCAQNTFLSWHRN